MTDIYPFDSWNFVFGYALQKVCVFSFARYDDRFEDKKAKYDLNKIKYYASKVMVHEIGHLFGFPHCIHNLCLMNGFYHREELDIKPVFFCPVCTRKLQIALGFSIKERFIALRDLTKTLQGE
jgi:archaemetzincin